MEEDGERHNDNRRQQGRVCYQVPPQRLARLTQLVRDRNESLPTTMPSRSCRYLSLLAVILVPLAQANPLSTHPYDVTRERQAFTMAPLIKEHHPHGSVNNSYIVMLKDDVAPERMTNHMNFVQAVHNEHPLVSEDEFARGLRHVYDGHVKGYSGHFSEQVIERIRGMPEVDFVERDQIVRTTDISTQRGAPWVCSCHWSSDSSLADTSIGIGPNSPP